MTNETDIELQREIYEHQKNAFNLLDEAKEIQEKVCQLPITDRHAVMNEVVALQTRALVESGKVIRLEAEQAANQREKISWQNVAYLNSDFFRVEN